LVAYLSPIFSRSSSSNELWVRRDAINHVCTGVRSFELTYNS
jgi:hypothetical protein